MKHKVREWGSRYIPSEIAGTAAAMIAAGIAFFVTGNPIITAYAGTWGENIGYYGSIMAKDKLSKKNRNNSAVKITRNMIIEFGPAEVLDSFVVRPFMMFMFPLLLGNLPLGILIGKLAADVIFYIPTIFSYEMRKKHLKD